MKRLGCSTLLFHKDDLDTALGKIARNGFKAIDFVIIPGFHNFDIMKLDERGYKDLRKKISDKGLRVSTLNTTSGVPLNDSEKNRLPIDHAKKCLDLAEVLGCYAITIQPGKKVSKEEWNNNAEIIKAALSEIADYGKPLGIDVTIESPHYKTIVEEFDQAKDMIDILASINVGTTIDTSHVIMSKTTIRDAIETFGDRIKHVHLRDAKEDSFLLTPGDGEVDFKEFFRLMDEIGYNRDYILELEYRNLPCEKREEELLRAKDWIQKNE